METLSSLTTNLGVLSLAAVSSFLFISLTKLQKNSLQTTISMGAIYGMVSVVVVGIPIAGPLGSTFDTRAAPILIAGYYYGPIGGGVAAVIGGVARYQVGGPAAIGGVVSFGLYLLAALIYRRAHDEPRLTIRRCIILSVLGSVCVVPSFFIGQPIESGVHILAAFWYVLLIGNIVGTLLLGLLVTYLREYSRQGIERDAILSSSPNGIVTVNDRRQILTMNRTAEEQFGWSIEEARGQPIEIFIPSDKRERHVELASNFASGREDQRRDMTGFRVVEARRKNLSRFPVLVSLTKFSSGAQPTIVATVHDMTEIVEARANLDTMAGALAEQLEQVLATNRAKNRFLSNLSHELRTPLNAIIGFSDLMRNSDIKRLPHDKTQEYVEDIHRSGTQLLAMIDDILDISRIEEDRKELSIEQHAVSDLIDSAVRMLKIKADEKNIKIEIASDDDYGVICDQQITIQVLANLISNAIKYGPKDSTIRITASENQNRVLVSVQDEGAGVPDVVLQHLGEPFLRGDTPEHRLIEGTGLGLAVSKKFLDRQDGMLTLERVEPRGTRATISLPAA